MSCRIARARPPLIFVAHAHLDAFSSPDDNPDTPSAAIRDERFAGLTRFVTYAQTLPEVRLVAARDILAWVQRAAGLTP